MTDSDRKKWDGRYRDEAAAPSLPAAVLSDYAYLLPAQGDALDLAAGLGANALFLARRGLTTSAWDISSVAMEKLARLAEVEGLSIGCSCRDIVAEPPQPDSFDLIVVSRFLDRSLCDAIAAALRPGGLLYYQTFTTEKVDGAPGPSNPDFLLQPNELLRLFPGLVIRVYHDEGQTGDNSQGIRDEALMVAQKPCA